MNSIGPETASQLVTSLEVIGEPSEEPLVDVTSVPTKPVKSPVGSGFDERPEEERETEIEEASLLRPAEEETTYEAGDIDVSSRPVIDSTVSIPTRAEDQTVAVAEDRGDQDSVL